MFYLLIGLLISLYYLFVAPESIRGTLNIVTLTLLLVAFLILFVLALFQIFELPGEFWVVVTMVPLTYFSLSDLHHLSQTTKKDSTPTH